MRFVKNFNFNKTNIILICFINFKANGIKVGPNVNQSSSQKPLGSTGGSNTNASGGCC